MDAAGAAGRLRAAGLRVTRPRLQAYEALARLGGHRTADEVAAALAESGHAMSRMSVYNALDALRRARLVTAADTGTGAVRHEVAGERHHHFVCRGCGSLLDVPAAPGEPVPQADLPGAQVDDVQVVFRGVCAGCLSAGRPTGAA